jgi:hypothetical protein
MIANRVDGALGADMGKGIDTIFRRSSVAIVLASSMTTRRRATHPRTGVAGDACCGLERGGDLGDDRGGLAMELRRRGVCRCDGAHRAQGLPNHGYSPGPSFWALGAVLMGIGWFCQRLLFQRTAALSGET